MKAIDRSSLVDMLRSLNLGGKGQLSLDCGGMPFLTTREEVSAAIDRSGDPGEAARLLRDLLRKKRIRLLAVSDEEFVNALENTGREGALDVSRTLLEAAGIAEWFPVEVEENRPAYASYGRQQIDSTDIRAVEHVLQTDFLTSGPAVAEFEKTVSALSGVGYGVAVSSGTAALHCAMHALNVGPGDEVIVPTLTFSASANCVLYQGGTPVFADILPDSLTLDPESARARITSRTKAIVAVDYAGQPCDYDALAELAREHNLALVADACHSIGGAYKGRPVGSLADITVYSFHPVKHVTCGEGGMLVTNVEALAAAARRFRNHGISRDFHDREAESSHEYDIEHVGFNYRMSDINAALGRSQVRRLDHFVGIRRKLAARYRGRLSEIPGIAIAEEPPGAVHAYHLFVVRVDRNAFGVGRNALFLALKRAGIGVNVHYPPVHLLTAYRRDLGTGPDLCPVAEKAAGELLSLPLHPGMLEKHVDHVVDCIVKSRNTASGVAGDSNRPGML